MSAVTKYHKCSDLKQHQFFMLQLGSYEVKNGSYWAKIKMLGLHSLLEALWGESSSFFFPVSRGCPHSLAHGPLLPSSKPATQTSSFSDCYLSDCLILPSSPFKDHCDYIGSTQLIQDHLPILSQLMSNLNNSILNLTFTLPPSLTYSQVPGIRIQISWGGRRGDTILCTTLTKTN